MDLVLLGQRVDFARTNMKKHDRVFSHEVVRAILVGMDVCPVLCSYRSMS